MSEIRSSALRATYRLQFNPDFRLDDATAIVKYLHDLGISHLYASPYLQSAAGSRHGYDVIDHGRVNEELGGTAAHSRLCRALAKQGMGQVLDIVPNHMSIGSSHNKWWWDVLENGRFSPFAHYFDVDWVPSGDQENKVLLPVLEDHYGRVLEAGGLKLERRGEEFRLCYHEHRFPVSLPSLGNLLSQAADRSGSSKLAFFADVCHQLKTPISDDRRSLRRRSRDQRVIREEIKNLFRQTEVKKAVDQEVEEINLIPDALDALLEQQHYRLAFWRAGKYELDFRRFFDINTLIGLRIEDADVFLDTHALILQWVREGALQGLRVDHPDGLRDPQEYLQRLAQQVPEAWVVVEKILEPGERLPPDWTVAGTTGYDFLNVVGGLFVDGGSEEKLSRLYESFTGQSNDYPTLVLEKKKFVLKQILASEVDRLTLLLVQICRNHRRYRDFTRYELHAMLLEWVAHTPVYRTYVRAGEEPALSDQDIQHATQAWQSAKSARPDLEGELFDFFLDILLLRLKGETESELVMRFQQLTGPAMAKGVEDTVFYNYNRLISLNEVGGDPGGFGNTCEEFHQFCQDLQQHWPETMLATSTHDTKRSEDVRARISLLSEMPEAWAAAVQRWSEANSKFRRNDWPDANIEYFLYQSLVGAWPIGLDRIKPYMEKVAREAKAFTSWTDPVPEYEEALQEFLANVMEDHEFIQDLEAFVEPLIEPGRINSLAQTLLKLTCPGVPDIYQGSEIWDLSLVDPDNRRPVDYALRRKLLRSAAKLRPSNVMALSDQGIPKIFLISRVLQIRADRPELFGKSAGYNPLKCRGQKKSHVVAFSRNNKAIIVAPRLVLGLDGRWQDTSLDVPRGSWTNRLSDHPVTGGRTMLADLLEPFPVALLTRS